MRSSIFAYEVCARYERGGRLHGALRHLVTTYPAQSNLQQKWQFYRAVGNELLNGFSLVDRGCWDYFDDDARAKRDFDMWTKGMTTEEGSRKVPSGSGDPYRGEPRFMTFTMAFLIANGSACDHAVRQMCNVPEPDLWRKATFHRLLSGLGNLNFASIQSDVAYLIPRDDGWGLTQEDLAQPKFEYLRTLV